MSALVKPNGTAPAAAAPVELTNLMFLLATEGQGVTVDTVGEAVQAALVNAGRKVVLEQAQSGAIEG